MIFLLGLHNNVKAAMSDGRSIESLSPEESIPIQHGCRHVIVQNLGANQHDRHAFVI
jgi:hypothetical protein